LAAYQLNTCNSISHAASRPHDPFPPPRVSFSHNDAPATRELHAIDYNPIILACKPCQPPGIIPHQL
jgi:hypothetical protein